MPGASSTVGVQWALWAAAAVMLVLTIRDLPRLRRVWREGTQAKLQAQRIHVENELLAELNGHLSCLVANATAAHDAIEGFDEAIEQSDQDDPARNKMASAMRRALVKEAEARVRSASAATARARAVDALPYRKRIEAIKDLIKELAATTP